MLRFLAEHRVAVAPQVAQLLGVTERTAATRLARLGELGLISFERIFDGQPAAASIRGPGLRQVGSLLPPPRVDLKGYRHDVGVGWLWLAANGGGFGSLSAVVSERQMRSHDMRAPLGGEPFGVGIVGLDSFGRQARHYPDLLLTTQGGERVAVELELTAKSTRRLDTIMRGYAGDPRIDGVLYVVSSAHLERIITAAATRAGITDLVRVHRLAGGRIHGAEPRGRRTAQAGRGDARPHTTGPRETPARQPAQLELRL